MSVERPLFHPQPLPAEIEVTGIDTPSAVYEVTLELNDEPTYAVFAFASDDPATIELLGPVMAAARPYLGVLRDAVVAHHRTGAVLTSDLTPGPLVPVPTFAGAPQVETVVITAIAREPDGRLRADLLVDGAPSRVVVRFNEANETYRLTERDARLDYDEGALVEWYLERFRAGHELDFPTPVRSPVVLFPAGTVIRSAKLHSIERMPGARVLRFRVFGAPGCHAQATLPDSTRGLHVDRRIGATRYGVSFHRLVKLYEGGAHLPYPIVLRARGWQEPEVVRPPGFEIPRVFGP